MTNHQRESFKVDGRTSCSRLDNSTNTYPRIGYPGVSTAKTKPSAFPDWEARMRLVALRCGAYVIQAAHRSAQVVSAQRGSAKVQRVSPTRGRVPQPNLSD